MTKKNLTTAYIVWSCVVLFYLYQYIIRVSPSVMADELMIAFDVTASGFGSLSAFAMYCYAAMQIPVGMMVDHYGTRRMVISSIVLCVSGVIIFATSEQLWNAYICDVCPAGDKLWLAYFSRMLIGTGSACAFLSVSKIINEMFPDSKKGLMLGLTATLGTIGALLGGAPLVKLIESQGWQGSLLILAIIGAFVLIMNFFALPKMHKPATPLTEDVEETPATFKSLFAVFSNRQTWLFAFVAVGIYMCIAVLADLWGVSFIIEKFGIDKVDAAQMVSYAYIGTAIGAPFFAWLSQRMHSFSKTIFIGAFGVTLLLIFVIFTPNIPVWAGNLAFFGMGLGTGAEILCFSGACRLMGSEVSGTMTGFLNGVVTLCAAIIQQNVGFLLHYFWDGQVTAAGLPIYNTYTYKIAFGGIMFIAITSCILSLYVKNPPEDN